jgi:hypothetical protein
MPISVSPLQYQSHNCDQLAAESSRINTRAAQLRGRLDQAASNDVALGWARALLFWPAVFWMGGTKQQEAEYARLKGEPTRSSKPVSRRTVGNSNRFPLRQNLEFRSLPKFVDHQDSSASRHETRRHRGASRELIARGP